MMEAWPGFFDPGEKKMWGFGSDVDWVRGDYVNSIANIGKFAGMNPWVVSNKHVAEAMVRQSAEQVVSILGALISWRVCTVNQLRAGLAVGDVPPFTRDKPNLYGAMCRLGYVNVGFSPRERLEGMVTGEVWLCVGNDSKMVRRVLSVVRSEPWLKGVLTASRLVSLRQHARHNTYAAHLGLVASRDERTKLITGDGWGAFRLIDAQATREAGLAASSATDVALLTQDNVLAGIEVQASSGDFLKKMRNWSKLLAFSPMSRRGLVCVWLLIRQTSSWSYPRSSSYVNALASEAESAVGNPNVGSRMGVALWEDWFDGGLPTAEFGSYTDIFGVRRSIYDPQWKEFTPEVRDPKTVGEWGWTEMRDIVARDWGWDISSWTLPEECRGGFYGFVGGAGQ